jgi:ABC-type sugar transport system ATPase subunit
MTMDHVKVSDPAPLPIGAEFAIECRNLVKVFPGTRALDGVDLYVRRGEIHALLGQNGAGKSTFIRAIAGADPPTTGSILVEGTEVRISSPQAARAFGIAVVHQHFNLAGDLPVRENLFLGDRLPRRWNGLIDWRQVTQKSKSLLDRLGLKIDPRATVSSLKPDELAMIAIARGIASDAKIIILDEPTAALLPDEVGVLFKHIRRLAAQGHAFLYVSHRLSEVFELADRITVLRDGRRVGTWPLGETSRSAVIAAIVGSEKPEVDEVRPTESSFGKIVLSATNAVGEGVSNLTFSLREGEVVGFAGLPGSGAEEALDLLYGRRPLRAGAIELHGKPLAFRNVRAAKAAGLALIPKDRHAEAMLGGLSVRANISLPILDKFVADPILRFVRRAREREHARQIVSTLSIKTAGVDTAIDNLSGGNQQKAILGRWLGADSRIFLMMAPTAAVDIGAKTEIYKLIRRLADDGAAILFTSPEVEEYRRVCNRVLVFQGGEIVSELIGEDSTETRIMGIAVGNIHGNEH